MITLKWNFLELHLRHMVYSNSNPVMKQNFWQSIQDVQTMTFEGTMKKIGYLSGIMLLSAICTSAFTLSTADYSLVYGLSAIAGISGFIIAMFIFMTLPENPQTLMTIYAVVEGVFIGVFSTLMELFFPGIALQAIFGTAILAFVMYGMYSSRIIRPTPRFNKIVGSLTLSIVFIYVISFVLSMFGVIMPLVHSNGPAGILFTVFVLGIGALMLVSDFGFIESSVRYGAPKKYEWYAAFGLLITIVWIYIEMVRLIAKLRSD